MLQRQDSTVISVPPPMIVVLSAPFHSSFLQITTVRSSTSAAVGSILSTDGVLISFPISTVNSPAFPDATTADGFLRC
ncbi:hypothetical protein CIB84_013330 [Bambusicola thoracicus]|uniref:Keratin n=1 Tax=Bambusicola thoracicus TaxID=9083 RepID=A0A2P4SFM5_BAMTH|nr:hypothetical protein CIB84_013330 [Bambusicola thoracicus]